MIVIGTEQLSASKPSDLDDKLIQATGCNAAEITAMLRDSPTPSIVARALHPCLAESMPLDALGQKIVDAGVAAVLPDVLALYAGADPPPAPAEPEEQPL